MSDARVLMPRPNVDGILKEVRSRAKHIDARVKEFTANVERAKVRASAIRERILAFELESRSVNDSALNLYLRNEALRVARARESQPPEALQPSIERDARTDATNPVALDNERLKFIDLFRNAPEAYLVSDAYGVIREANVVAGTLFNLPAHFLAGKPLLHFVARQDTRAFRAVVQGVRAVDQIEPMHIRMRPRHKPVFRACLTASTLKGIRGSTVGIRWIVREVAVEETDQRIRELEAALAKAEAASAMKDRFLGMIAAELRAPIQAVRGWVDVLQQRPVEPVPHANALEAIHKSFAAVLRMAEDLLDIASIESRKVTLAMAPVDLGSVIERALASTLPAAKAKGVAVETSVARCPTVGDAARLEQIVTSLVTNAIELTPSGGKVTLALERNGTSARLSVRDTGKGISPALLPHIFEAFRLQTHASDSSVGLGLAVVQQLVELHGGTVQASSRGDGMGSSFVVSLPLGDALVDNV